MSKRETGALPRNHILDYVRAVFRLWLGLCRIMIPVIIAVKVLNEFDIIRYLAIPLSPLMTLVGLPAEMGLVWATTMLNNIYGGMIVLMSLPVSSELSSAQATVLGTMMLLAHTLPVELGIAQGSGARPLFQAVSRIGSAVLLGFILHVVFTSWGLLQGPASMMLQPTGRADVGLTQWATGEALRLLWILAIIAVLVALMRLLKAFGGIRILELLLRPLLSLLGIGPKATAITVIGLTMGLAYGGGLIIEEAKSDEVGPRDVFFSLTLMGLVHSLIEDTLLIMTIGGAPVGILFGRLVYGLVVVMVLVKVVSILPPSFCERFLWRRL